MTDQAHARSTDPATSHQAAASLSPDELSRVQRNVREVIRRYGPMTDEKLVDVYGYMGWGQVSPSGLRSRRKELVAKGFVRDSGERATLASGRKAIIWEYVSPESTPATQSESLALFP